MKVKLKGNPVRISRVDVNNGKYLGIDLLTWKDINNGKIVRVNNFSNSILVLTGNGSKLFDKNTFYMNDEYNFKEIIFYEEKDIEICLTGLKFDINSHDSDLKEVQKSLKKIGIFEKFFNFFGR